MVLDKVKSILADQLDIDVNDISENTDIGNDLGADSLDVVEIMMSIEDTFSIEFDEEDISKFQTVGSVVAYIESKI